MVVDHPGYRVIGPHSPYGIVEATDSFVSERLVALAGALALPAPVRDTFLFDASDAFYRACTGSPVTLQHAARRVIEHLGLSADAVLVSFVTSTDFAGRVERQGGDWFIEISERHRGDAHALGAVLAHEVSHILVHERGLRTFGSALDEVHVDLAAMLSGLGPLTLNAIVDRETAEVGATRYEHSSLGYLRAPLLEHAYALVASRLRIPSRVAVAPLRGPVVARAVRRRMRAQWVRSLLSAPPPLRFGALPPHVVVRCASEACPQRLRVPSAKRGRARCPACKAERAFDGTPLPTTTIAAPSPLEPVELPDVAAPSTIALARRAPPVPPLAEALFVGALVVVWLGSLWADAASSRAPVGARCTSDLDCRSGLCVQVTEDRSAAVHRSLAIAVEGIGAPVPSDQGPLDPARTDARWVDVESAYCTEACEQSSDCPVGLVCEVDLARCATSRE